MRASTLRAPAIPGRGLNENSNGLLRQYFPKGIELIDVTDEHLQQAVDRLNHRPHKVRRFRTLARGILGNGNALHQHSNKLHFELESTLENLWQGPARHNLRRSLCRTF
jgi:hypothetical protein